MKIKCVPEDFQVEELPTAQGGEEGRFILYRLTKRGLGTLEAVEAIRRRWNLSGHQVRYGGLKDRHAVTVQYLTILNGPQRRLRESSFELEPVGHLPQPYGPSSFRGNRFLVVIRDLTSSEVERAREVSARVPLEGLPNYFDDQRFGSVRPGGEFIALAWLLENPERALWLAIAEPNPFDRSGTRSLKGILREHWGRWAEAKARLPRSHERSLVTYLADHPTDFRGAFARLNKNLRSLYFSAFQSHLWNLLLARHLEHRLRPEQWVRVEFKAAALPIPRRLDSGQVRDLRTVKLPLPASRTSLPSGTIGDQARDLISGFGLTWERLRVRHLKDVFFSKGDRPAWFFPENWRAEIAGDDLHPGRGKLELRFDLPKGSYATLVVKRLTDAA
jgi:tRNA pseudouridine13 synthase